MVTWSSRLPQRQKTGFESLYLHRVQYYDRFFGGFTSFGQNRAIFLKSNYYSYGEIAVGNLQYIANFWQPIKKLYH
jgi:hypothetical protein